MAAAPQKLAELATVLERQGADPLRLDTLRRAQRFKRSWIEMAEALLRVREARAYLEWGYDDFHAYCARELHIKKATAEKLTVSFVALERHAPRYLDPDAPEAPDCDAVGYFARALGVGGPEEPEVEDAPASAADEVAEELRQAVFDEGAPVAVLRRRFDPVLYPKPEGAAELALLEKTDAAARRLANLLAQLEGSVPRRRVIETEDALEALRDELLRAIPKLRERVEHAGDATVQAGA